VSVPEWVRTAAAAPLPQYEPDTDAVVLLDDVCYSVTNAGEYVEHYRRAVKILRPEGREEANFQLHFGQKEKVLSLHAWTIDKSGHEYELRDKDFAERGAFAFELYSACVGPGRSGGFRVRSAAGFLVESSGLGISRTDSRPRSPSRVAASARLGVSIVLGRRCTGPGGKTRKRHLGAARPAGHKT
jgi:hypothetical protein